MSQQPNDPVLEITQSILTEAARRPWLAALLMRRKPEWLTRLAHLAQRIRQLPQHTRRTLRRKLTSGLAAAALLLALAGTPAAYAGTIMVDGVTCTLADAITTANSGTDTGGCTGGSGADTITLTADINLTAAVPNITSDITIEGGGHTIAGNNTTFRVLTIAAGNVTLNQATITGGKVTSSQGGGIYNHGTLTVTNSTLSGNSAVDGGGIYNRSGGTLTVNNSTISGNSANASGGGIFSGAGGTLTVNNSTLSSNTANYGGGLYTYGLVMIKNSTISGNTANSGGGIYNNQTMTVQNSTVVSNATVFGGGVRTWGGTTTVQNSIVALQTSGVDCGVDSGGTFISQGYNIESATSCGFTGTGDQQNQNSAALNLGALANNGVNPHPFTHALLSGSVAIDKIPIGTNGCASTNADERGAQRAGGGTHGGSACDVGAYEVSDQTPTAIALRDLTATATASPGVIGLIGATLAALGVTWSLRRRRAR